MAYYADSFGQRPDRFGAGVTSLSSAASASERGGMAADQMVLSYSTVI